MPNAAIIFCIQLVFVIPFVVLYVHHVKSGTWVPEKEAVKIFNDLDALQWGQTRDAVSLFHVTVCKHRVKKWLGLYLRRDIDDTLVCRRRKLQEFVEESRKNHDAANMVKQTRHSV